jgi:CxxC motif-containing protein (DUF1111 family)
MKNSCLSTTVFLVLLLSACDSGSSGGGPTGFGGTDRVLQGGDTTSNNRTSQAFEDPAPNLTDEETEFHFEGDIAFGAKFVTAPAPVNPGLGPQFNHSSCDSCHVKNGRGNPVLGVGPLGSQALVRVSIPSGVSSVPDGPRAVPGLGTQLQDHAIFGLAPEARIDLSWETVNGTYADGEAFELRRPLMSITLADGSALPREVETSLRTAPPVFGLGLLEAIPEAAIIANADPEDADGDGISGRVNMVWDVLAERKMLGRFGRKANSPNILQQTAAAYLNDMGVTNPVFRGVNGESEIDTDTLIAAEFYTQSLAVPPAGSVDDEMVNKGAQLFSELGCVDCHIPSFRTGEHPLAAVSNQTIFAYTDLLLHDMGEGLADNRPDFEANGREWKTPPLWGTGIARSILGNRVTFLHDGRARSISEAILWHGGEAEMAKEKFRSLTASDRDALVRFLRSL